ncbi:MAG: class I SAM-dependent methyltransferase, partial [Chloroflexota bacterium]
NRDVIVKRFLEDKSRAEWLLMLDSDQEYIDDIGLRLTRWKQPVVGGLYFHRGHMSDPLVLNSTGFHLDQYGRQVELYGPLRDDVYDWLEETGVPARSGAFAINVPGTGEPFPGALRPCDAVGTGGIVIHRSVLEAMTPPWFEYCNGWGSEDLEFCKRVREELGLPVHCDFSTVSGHYMLVATGQAEFRQMYLDRGMAAAVVMPKPAVEWLASFFEVEPGIMAKRLQEYRPQEMAGHWIAHAPADAAGQQEWYRRTDTGQLYVLDLLRWNMSGLFRSLQERLKAFRGGKVIELGAGIGTMAIQLALQRNDVLAVEPNDLLQDFITHRWDALHSTVSEKRGELVLADLPAGTDYTLAVAVDIFEHLPAVQAEAALRDLSRRLLVGGRLFCHNNFGQQELYPMHFDHGELWPRWVKRAGLFPLSPVEYVRVK